MKYKALLIDLDGTTVPVFSHEISSRVKSALTKANEKMFVSIATGRPLSLLQPILRKLPLRDLCVISNGGQIYDPKTNEIVKEIALDKESVGPLFELLRSFNVTVQVFNGEVERPLTKLEPNEKVLSYYLPDIPVSTLEAIMEAVDRGFPTAICHRLNGTVKGVESLEVSHASATKQSGVYEIIKKENINPDELIGIGDGYNDFPLLLGSGLKIAMGNAVPELKTIADFICPSVDQDGLAVFIEKFILDE